MPVTLQRHVKGEPVWRTVSTGATNANGVRAWSVKQAKRHVLPRGLQGRDDLARLDLEHDGGRRPLTVIRSRSGCPEAAWSCVGRV